jgi:hypothetical protein
LKADSLPPWAASTSHSVRICRESRSIGLQPKGRMAVGTGSIKHHSRAIPSGNCPPTPPEGSPAFNDHIFPAPEELRQLLRAAGLGEIENRGCGRLFLGPRRSPCAGSRFRSYG